jgi:hypothetical protein
MITVLMTCSHDFIYTVTTLFAQLQLYLLGTPSAEDRRIEDHRYLNRPVAKLCGESLLSRPIDSHESVPQSEVELLDESRDEGCQQSCADPPESFRVSESVHKSRGSGAHQNHTVIPAK